jgi:hypothetical protein
MPISGSSPTSRCEELSLSNWSDISFTSFPMCPSMHISWILLYYASFTRDW